ncbi:MAG: class I SAM-dependent methyltransferase [Dehalococcoidia bacterium]|jgi:trans-aconitate methyltransferase
MNNEELRQQYNDIYKEKPDKWTSNGRDNDAWFMLDRILGKAPKTLLDIGCGNGHTIKYFSDRWKTTRYTGLDISDEAIEIAKSIIPDVLYLCGEIEEVQIDCNYDVITILGTAEHFPDIGKKMKYISQFLEPKGVLYLEVPNNLSYSENKEEGFRVSLGGNQKEWHLTKESWNKILEEAGLVTYITRTYVDPFPIFIWILQKSQLLENPGE